MTDVALREAQTENTLFLLKMFDVGVPLVTSPAATLIMTTCKIIAQETYDVRAKLKSRRPTPDAAQPSG